MNANKLNSNTQYGVSNSQYFDNSSNEELIDIDSPSCYGSMVKTITDGGYIEQLHTQWYLSKSETRQLNIFNAQLKYFPAEVDKNLPERLEILYPDSEGFYMLAGVIGF